MGGFIKPVAAAASVASLVLSTGCSGLPSLPGLSTGAVSEKPAPKNDPTSRAFQVGTASARALKCGFNFDPGKLKSDYLAYEAGLAAAPAAPIAPTPEAAAAGGEAVSAPASPAASPVDLAQIEKIYNVSFNGVAKAVAGAPDYCTDAKVKTVRADLHRHLAGDYTPRAPEPEPEDDGLFGSASSSSSEGFNQRLPTDNRWD